VCSRKNFIEFSVADNLKAYSKIKLPQMILISWAVVGKSNPIIFNNISTTNHINPVNPSTYSPTLNTSPFPFRKFFAYLKNINVSSWM
jgi:hypothetical protein